MGDGLEMYVVIAKGRSVEPLVGLVGVQEVTTIADGDRMFIIRRELKKD